jgi:hypothetical protein
MRLLQHKLTQMPDDNRTGGHVVAGYAATR